MAGLADTAKQWAGVVGGLGTILVIGWIGETNVDGGFIKDIWGAMKTAGPATAMVTSFLAMVIWRAWQRDRDEHAARTIDYINGMNAAARLRETDMHEKAKLRDRIAELERSGNKRHGRQ